MVVALQSFVDKVGPVVSAAWLNSVDQFVNRTYAVGTSENPAAVVNYRFEQGRLYRYGTVLNSATFQIALNNNVGGTVYLEPDSVLVLDDEVTVPINTSIAVWGNGKATIDASTLAATSQPPIYCIGSLGAALGNGLTATVAAGADTFTFTTPPVLSPGDELVLRNPTNGSWNGDNASYRQGEILELKTLAGAVATLCTSVIDTYAGVTIEVNKVTTTSTCIVGDITILGNPNDTNDRPFIFIQYGRNCIISGLKFRNMPATGLELSTCYNCIVSVSTGKFIADPVGIQATGVIANGQNILVYASSLHGSRHGASTGGGGVVVSRFVLFYDCDISSKQNSAADLHGAAEFCCYSFCSINGGVNLSGASNSLEDSVVYPSIATGTAINMEANLSISHSVVRNKIYLYAAGYALDANAAGDINANTTRNGKLLINDNVVQNLFTGAQTLFFIRNNGSLSANSLEFKRNKFIGTSAGTTAVLGVSFVSGINFKEINFSENELENCNWGSAAGSLEFIFKDNAIRRQAADIDNVTISGDGSNIFVENNVSSGGGGAVVLSKTGGASINKLISVKGNTFKDTNPAGNIPLVIANATLAVCSGNTVGEVSDASQTNPVSFDTITTLRIMADEAYQGTGVPSLTSVATLKEHPWWVNYTPTVTLVGGAGNTVPVYSTNQGRWMQLGKTVFVDILLTGDGGAEGAGTGKVNIAIPVAVGANAVPDYHMAGRLSNNALRAVIMGELPAAATTIALIYFDTIGTIANVSGDTQNNTTRLLKLNFRYEVD